MIKSFFKMVSPAGFGARLSILIFHRVLQEPDPLFPGEVDAAQFDNICRWLKAWFNVLPLDEAVKKLGAATLPERACAITFDDGYADNYHVARPILQRHGLPATFFIATGFLDGGRMWNDTVIEAVRRTPLAEIDLANLSIDTLGKVSVASLEEKRAAIGAIIGKIKYMEPTERRVLTEHIAESAQVKSPTDLMMTSDEVRGMRSAGMQLGAHTVSHPILAKLGRKNAQSEIMESKLFLEQLLGERIGLFAYPNGRPGADYSSESVAVVREAGFDAAVSTVWGAGNGETDLFQIPRFSPWDRKKLRFALRMAGNYKRPVSNPLALETA